ncbi:MAG: RnfABCDGE type electron transport complex subunit A [Bacilli bacterium]|nr:RnfABCDGE type electron transport complex subunit A [Bacilli bacterium]
MGIVTLIISAMLVSNVVLVRFLGTCPFLGVSKKISNAIGLGLATMFVVFFSSLLSYGLYHLVLKPLGLEFLSLVSFILIIASFVQFVEMFLKKVIPSLYRSLGIYLPLITTNCIVLAIALENVANDYSLLQTIVYSLSVSAGFLLVLILFSVIRERVDSLNRVPQAFKGVAIALIITALMTMAFFGFQGLV